MSHARARAESGASVLPNFFDKLQRFLSDHPIGSLHDLNMGGTLPDLRVGAVKASMRS